MTAASSKIVLPQSKTVQACETYARFAAVLVCVIGEVVQDLAGIHPVRVRQLPPANLFADFLCRQGALFRALALYQSADVILGQGRAHRRNCHGNRLEFSTRSVCTDSRFGVLTTVYPQAATPS